ncbi:hypothetical protein ABT039_22445 [Streptomyces lasiicapitis]|uniref:hypothetical protein n=1 Tax=Streptomyces lasiicapitis TaxID=1923961 RepID=UPI00331948DB
MNDDLAEPGGWLLWIAVIMVAVGGIFAQTSQDSHGAAKQSPQPQPAITLCAPHFKGGC